MKYIFRGLGGADIWRHGEYKSEGYYEDMPLGPTEDYATIVGNIFNNPELKVDSRYRSLAETERECR